MKPRGLLLLVLAGLGMASTPLLGADEDVVVVLSSSLGPYKQALQGFENAFGRPVPSYILSEQDPIMPPDARVIVAIGGKAAVHPYPSRPLLIYCLAPGTQMDHNDHPGPLLNIYTSPSIYVTVSKFRGLQPSLKRLAILWASDSIQNYMDQKNDAAKRTGVEIISDRVRSSDDLPDHLRALKGKADAIWLPLDAAMVTPKNFATIKEFSLANDIPFYVPSDGLVEQGAVASVSASFEEIGALAARMAKEALAAPLETESVFPEKSHLAINMTAAKNCALTISPDVVKQADKVFP